jgi:hypothetical protein
MGRIVVPAPPKKFEPAATAAAGALALVAVDAALYPLGLESQTGVRFADALINELIVWFILLYLMLLGLTALIERVTRPRGTSAETVHR